MKYLYITDIQSDDLKNDKWLYSETMEDAYDELATIVKESAVYGTDWISHVELSEIEIHEEDYTRTLIELANGEFLDPEIRRNTNAFTLLGGYSHHFSATPFRIYGMAGVKTSEEYATFQDPLYILASENNGRYSVPVPNTKNTAIDIDAGILIDMDDFILLKIGLSPIQGGASIGVALSF